jgi:hypothetical protein
MRISSKGCEEFNSTIAIPIVFFRFFFPFINPPLKAIWNLGRVETQLKTNMPKYSRRSKTPLYNIQMRRKNERMEIPSFSLFFFFLFSLFLFFFFPYFFFLFLKLFFFQVWRFKCDGESDLEQRENLPGK